MIYSRHRYNEVVKSIFSVVKVAHYRRFQQANWRQLWSIPCHHLAPSLPLKNRGDCLGVAAINRCRYSRYMLQFSSRYYIYIYIYIYEDRSRFFMDEKWKIVMEVCDTVSQWSFTGWINGREKRRGEGEERKRKWESYERASPSIRLSFDPRSISIAKQIIE